MSGDTQKKVVADIHARIPMPMAEEQRALQLENAEEDARLWDQLHDFFKENGEAKAALAARLQREAEDIAKEAEAAAASATKAHERIAKLKAGESVPGGFTRAMTWDDAKAFMEAGPDGWKKADFDRARNFAALGELLGEENFSLLLSRLSAEERKVGDRYINKRSRELLASLLADSGSG